MAPLRIRYSKGTANIDVDLDAGTVLDLQQAILKATQILPSQQEGKSRFMFHFNINMLLKLSCSKAGLPTATARPSPRITDLLIRNQAGRPVNNKREERRGVYEYRTCICTSCTTARSHPTTHSPSNCSPGAASACRLWTSNHIDSFGNTGAPGCTR